MNDEQFLVPHGGIIYLSRKTHKEYLQIHVIVCTLKQSRLGAGGMDHKFAKFIVSLYIIVFPPRIDDPRSHKTFLSSFACHNGVNFLSASQMNL